MKTIKTGIVGAGFISDFHIRALREDPSIEISGICDVNGARAEKLAEKWSVAGAFDNIHELVERTHPDVVHIVTPPPDHLETTQRFMEKGIATLVEKPVVTSSAECKVLLATERRTGSYVGVNHNAAFSPAFQRLVQLIQTKRLGGVQHVMSCLNVPLRQLSAGQHSHWMFKAPGNILLEQAPHPLSQVHFLLGKTERISMLQSGERVLNTGSVFFDTWQASLACERGTAQCFFSFGKECPEWWIYVVGQDGSAFADLRRNVVRYFGKSRFVDPAAYAQAAVSNGFEEARQGLRNFVNYGLGFLKLRATSDPFYCSLRDSIHGFHKAYRNGDRPPIRLVDACDVVDTCERMADLIPERMAMHANS